MRMWFYLKGRTKRKGNHHLTHDEFGLAALLASNDACRPSHSLGKTQTSSSGPYGAAVYSQGTCWPPIALKKTRQFSLKVTLSNAVLVFALPLMRFELLVLETR